MNVPDWKLVLVLALAAVTRLSFLGLIEFKADEALTVLSLQQFWERPQVIEAGLVSSTGVKNFPLFQYMLIWPAAISTDPRWLSAVIGLMNAVMVGWFYVATKRAFGKKVALIAGLVLAVAPYPVLFSRKIWAQDLVMLFAVPIYDLMLRAKPNNFWLGLGLTVLAQLHGSGLFFMLVVIVWLLAQKKFDRKMVVGMAVGLLPAIPYFISGAFSRPLSPYLIDLHHLLLPATLLTTFSWAEVMGSIDFERFTAGSPAVGFGWLVSMVAIVSLGWGAWRQKSLATVVAGLVLVYIMAGVPGRLHYYLVVLPWVAALTGVGMVRLFTKQGIFLGPSVGMMVTGYLLFWGMFLRYVTMSGGVVGDYGVPYRYTAAEVAGVMQRYAQRDDVAEIQAIAYFDPVLARDTNGAMRHYNLALYFKMRDEKDLAEFELERAVELDSRFGELTMSEKED